MHRRGVPFRSTLRCLRGTLLVSCSALPRTVSCFRTALQNCSRCAAPPSHEVCYTLASPHFSLSSAHSICIPNFAVCSPHNCTAQIHSAAIDAVGKRINLRPDEPLYLDRAPADVFFLLISGRVRADAVPWPAGTGVSPPPLETPALIGASSFLTRTARRETVRADGPASLIAIGPHELEASPSFLFTAS